MKKTKYQDKLSWLKKSYSETKERKTYFKNLSSIDIEPLYTYEDRKHLASGLKVKEKVVEVEELGFPGQYPFTRGVYPSMYRGRLWTMRQFAGFGSPVDTNLRFKYLIDKGQTGLSTAFDMPTLMGYDADHELSIGEVGREGVSVSTIEEMRQLFDSIDLSQVSTSMTINCTAAPILAMYFAVALEKNKDLTAISGTIQNDILKEYIAQKEWISPPKAGLKLACDLIEYCTESAPKFNPISISGYHIREAGATAVQELAFTLYDGLSYVESCIGRGMDVDSFAPRLSFFFDVHNDFFEEIAKLRAARRIWARLMKERFSAKNEKSMLLRMHTQTAGVTLTAQQPMNNIARVTLQALAAVLGGTQSLHTNSMDETLSLPTEDAVLVALRTQQIIAEETGVVNTIDPLAGSYYLESLTDQIEVQALAYIKELDDLGGMLQAIDQGFPQKEISISAYQFQKDLEEGKRVIVGVNKYNEEQDLNIPLHKIDNEVEKKQRENVAKFKLQRDQVKVKAHLEILKQNCKNDVNIMPDLIKAVNDGVSVGEVSDVYREVYGVYTDPGVV